jgi:hypothetical protein
VERVELRAFTLVDRAAVIAFADFAATIGFAAGREETRAAVIAFVDLAATIGFAAGRVETRAAVIAFADFAAIIGFAVNLAERFFPTGETRISPIDLPVPDLIFAFCAGVNWILTSFAIFCFPPELSRIATLGPTKSWGSPKLSPYL